MQYMYVCCNIVSIHIVYTGFTMFSKVDLWVCLVRNLKCPEHVRGVRVRFERSPQVDLNLDGHFQKLGQQPIQTKDKHVQHVFFLSKLDIMLQTQ